MTFICPYCNNPGYTTTTEYEDETRGIFIESVEVSGCAKCEETFFTPEQSKALDKQIAEKLKGVG